MENNYIIKLIENGIVSNESEFEIMVASLKEQIKEMNASIINDEDKCCPDDYIFGFFNGCLYLKDKMKSIH